MAPTGNLFKLIMHKNAAAALRTARVAAGLTSQDAAKIAQIPQPDYSRIETGKKQYMMETLKERLEKLAEQLHIKLQFEEASWSEVRQKSKRKAVPVRVRITEETEELFAAPESVAVPPPAPMAAPEDTISTLLRLTQQGILNESEFKGAVFRVVENTLVEAARLKRSHDRR